MPPARSIMNRDPLARFLCVYLLVASAHVWAQDRPPEVQSLMPCVALEIVAEHPALATPTGIDVDEQGRVWTVSTHTHFRPEDYEGPEHDEILILTDSNGDGKLNQRQVFYDKTDATMDLELGPDGWVYLAPRDRIIRIRDRDGDGVADTEQTIATLETEADYPHNGLEGLTWHPGGDLIFGLGENFAKPWKLTGADGAEIQGSGEGGIFRCRADGTDLRRIARGFWNPFGICVRPDGNMFAAENDPGERPPCRILHVVEGGDYGYQRAYGNAAHHPFVGWNGELRGTLPMLHPSAEAPCGILPVGNGLLVPSWSDHRIDLLVLSPHGATFRAERHTLAKGGRYFRPSCIAEAPAPHDGQRVFYLNDWVDGRYQAHGYGRVWRLTVDTSAATWMGGSGHTLAQPMPDATLAQSLRDGSHGLSTQRLLALCDHEDPFISQAALVALSEAADWTASETLSELSAAHRVHAVQALKLAGASGRGLIPELLQSSDEDVRFETLRWISDKNLTAFRDDVENLLETSTLSFRIFEAAVATLNTLEGRPEAGVQDPKRLLERVRDPQTAPAIRAFALRLLPTLPRNAKPDQPNRKTFPKGLDKKLLRTLLKVGDQDLSMEVIHTMSANTVECQDMLAEIAFDPGQPASLRAEAIASLGPVAEAFADELSKAAQQEDADVRTEATRVLRLLKENDQVIGGRPGVEDVAAWQARLDAVESEPDIDRGRRIFHSTRLSQCSNCHRHTGRGNIVGPDLSRVGASAEPGWLLRSIIQPSWQMAPEYQPRTVLLTDGRVFTGIRLRSSTREAMRDTNGQNRTFDRDEIESMVESDVSFMPTGLADRLTDEELRDLIAFLQASI